MPIILVSIDLLNFFRDQESSKTNSHLQTMNENNHDVVVKSEESDSSYVQSVESSSVDDGDSTLSTGGVETRVKLYNFPFNYCSGAQMVINSYPYMHVGK